MAINKNTVVNFILFQAGWFACVLGAAQQLPWLGIMFLAIFLIWHLSQANQPKFELILIAIALLIGGLYDLMMTRNNLLTYQSHGWSTALPAAWILALWAEFAMTLNVSLRWLKNLKTGRLFVAMLFGAIGGPLAYIGAAKLGAVTINTLPLSYVALSIGWAIITPILILLSDKFDGFKPIELVQT